MVIADTDPVPPLFLGRVKNGVPEVVSIIGGAAVAALSGEPAGDEPSPSSGSSEATAPPERMDAPPPVSPPPSPSDADGEPVPRKRRRW